MRKRTSELYALECLITLVSEAHVTRAADRLGISQPAMSAMLGKLRARFGDPLLVKTEAGMVATPRARDLAGRALEALDGVKRIFEQDVAFDPAQGTAHFELVVTESVGFFLMPRLMAHLRAHAPGITLSVRQPDLARLREELEEARADMMIGYLHSVAPTLRVTRLHGRTLRVIASRRHPEIQGKLSLDQYLRYPHVCYHPTPSGGSTVEQQVERRLARRKLYRKVALYSPSVLSFPAIVEASDLLATIAADVAQPLADHFNLQVLKPPLDFGPVDMAMYWHERAHRNPAHQWLRQAVVQLTK